MIDRDQVLHVARLARLRLDEDEVVRMSAELSSIIGHVETMSELDIEGIEPTSRVVDAENVVRADEIEPSLPRQAALANAPDPASDSFRVPSPQA